MLKVNDENSKIRIRIHQSEVRINGSETFFSCKALKTFNIYATMSDQKILANTLKKTKNKSEKGVEMFVKTC